MPTPAAARDLQQHVIGLDLLRFAASLLVVAFHLGYWFWATTEADVKAVAAGPPAFPELAPATHFGWIGVQIFFVISGFVIAGTAARSAPLRFAVGRIVRLAPAMWICASLTLLVALLAGADVDAHGPSWVRSVTFAPYGPWIDKAHWTLAIEIAFYCGVFVLLAIGRERWLRPAAIAMGLASTVYGLLAYARFLLAGTTWHASLPWIALSRTEELLLAHGCEFALGVLLWTHHAGDRRPLDPLWRLLFFGGACAQILVTGERFAHVTGHEFGAGVAVATFGIALALFAAALAYQERLAVRLRTRLGVVRTMGLMTYPLYLVHQEVGVYAIAGLAAVGVPRFGALALAVAAAIALSWLVAVALEPPLQRALRALLLRTAPRALGRPVG
jgi:peptidoglycan/LPS O-acetylase OafA/YrhL